MRFSTLIALSTAFLVAYMGIAAPVRSDDRDQVREIVEAYLHGLKFNDIESFKKAFHPDAKLFFVKKNRQLGELNQTTWYKGFEKSAGKEEKGELKIASMDVTDSAASVKVTEVYPDSTYTDYLNLLKLEGKWQIVNKVFTSKHR